MPAEIKVPLLDRSSWSGLESLSDSLDQLNRAELKNESWPQFKTKCTACFAMAHDNSSILLKFYIKNDHFKSSCRKINGEVNNDNCVEFFIAFDGEADYYNLEFNFLGIGKMAYGTGRENRTFLPVASIKKIEVWSNSERQNEDFNWEIMLVIPIAVFEYHQLANLNDKICRGNFYKCGDELPAPHFLSWNKINALHPDFHKPDYFGAILFEGAF